MVFWQLAHARRLRETCDGLGSAVGKTVHHDRPDLPDRWQIELYFKALKQNLKVKTFLGTSRNALEVQLWTAPVAMVLVKYLQWRSRRGWSLSNLVALLRWNLFRHKGLWAWLDDPLGAPPGVPNHPQLALPGFEFGQPVASARR